ncbi:MAG TPA: cytochrome c [Methylocella sp.]|nr:cytochrome c [Methylocella sp.]
MPLLFPHGPLVAAFLTIESVSYAKPLTYELPDATATYRSGPGMETAQNNCLTCHSSDYISTQPPNRGKAFWDAEVTKMIKVYHAPINEADAKAIADYLAKTY